LPEEEEMAFWDRFCWKHPAPHSTWNPKVWGSELLANRYFSFLVGDSTLVTVSAADFRPKKVYGFDMGPEWNEALAFYWRMRDTVQGVRKTSESLKRALPLPERYPGPDPLLEYYDSKRNVKDDSKPEPKKKLKLLLPPPPSTTKPKRRRRPGDPGPVVPISTEFRRNAPSLPPSASTSGGKVNSQPLESEALATAKALYREATRKLSDRQLSVADADALAAATTLYRSANRFVPDYDSDDDLYSSDEDAENSDEDEDDVELRRAMVRSLLDLPDPEQRRDSGGGVVDDGGVGPAPKEEKQEDQKKPDTRPKIDIPMYRPPATSMPPPPSRRPSSTAAVARDGSGSSGGPAGKGKRKAREATPSYSSPGTNSVPYPTLTSPDGQTLSMIPPASPRPASLMLPPPPRSPRSSSSSSSMLLPPLPPPSPRPSSSQLLPPPSPRPTPLPLPPVALERKRKFDANPGLDEDYDSDDDADHEIEDEVMEDVSE
jgi:hypothetical protein